MFSLRKFAVLIFAVFLVFSASADSTPNLPQVIDGDLKVSGEPFESGGENYEGPVYAVYNGLVDKVEATNGSFQDLVIQGMEEGDEVDILINPGNMEGVIKSENLTASTVSYLPGDTNTTLNETVDVEGEDYGLGINAGNVDGGETLSVEAKLSNSGDVVEGEQNIVLEVSGDEKDSIGGIKTVDSGTFNLEWDTEEGDAGDYEAKVYLESDESVKATESFEVENSTEEETAPAGSSGGTTETFDENILLTDISEGDTRDIDFESSPITGVDLKFSDGIDKSELSSEAEDSMPDEADEVPSGEVYSYVELRKTNFTNYDVESVTFDLEVEKDWVEDNHIIEDSIDLRRWEDGSWESLDPEIESEDEEKLYFSVESSELSVFSITGEKAESEIGIKDLTLSSASIEPNESVKINLVVENTGERSGDYTVSLDLAGESFEEQIEDLGPGNTVTVSFAKEFDQEGNYRIDAGDLSASVTVGDPDLETMGSETEINQTNETIKENKGQDEFPFTALLILVLVVGFLTALALYLYTHEEKREELFEGLENLVEKLEGVELSGDGRDEDDFDWDGFDS